MLVHRQQKWQKSDPCQFYRLSIGIKHKLILGKLASNNLIKFCYFCLANCPSQFSATTSNVLMFKCYATCVLQCGSSVRNIVYINTWSGMNCFHHLLGYYVVVTVMKTIVYKMFNPIMLLCTGPCHWRQHRYVIYWRVRWFWGSGVVLLYLCSSSDNSSVCGRHDKCWHLRCLSHGPWPVIY